MKRLIIVRHAKSSWEYDVIDHQRPLKNRGRNDALLVSNEFKSYNLKPEIIFSSDAERAKKTAEIFKKVLEIEDSLILLKPELYDFGGIELLKFIKSIPEDLNFIMIFGHNHAITAFVNEFGNKYTGNVPTSGLTMIEFDIDSWSQLEKGKTLMSIYPRDLK